jgi:DNA recombination protein RmuC
VSEVAPLIWILVLAALVVGGLVGYVLSHLRASRRVHAVQLELEAERARRVAEAESEARLRATFGSLAGESLRANNEMFLSLARETLGKEQIVAQGALKERETAIAQLVDPLRAALEKTEAQVQTLEKERRDAFSTLRTQIEGLTSGQVQLARETRNLITALRRPEVRGRWGEMTLRRVVELAGMAEHCDFTEQMQIFGDEGALRPDMVVHMPDHRDLVVDVKTPLDAYLEALEAVTEEARTVALRRHAQQVEARIRQLGSKSYWAQFANSPEFVILFIPGDQFLSAALAERPELIDNALKQSVIIATPSTFIALLKTVAYGWRQSDVAHNAAVIHELGEQLYRRLGSFTEHLSKLGRRVARAASAAAGAALSGAGRHLRRPAAGDRTHLAARAQFGRARGQRSRRRVPRTGRRQRLIVPDGTLNAAPVHPGPGFPTASLRYFVWLYSPPEQQPVVQSLLGLEREIAGTLRAVTEHQVVHVRLEWWRQECERFLSGNPVHPLMRALLAVAQSRKLTDLPRGISGFVDVATWDLAGATFETRRELQAYCERWSNAMFDTLAAFAGGTSPAIRSVGAAAREIEFLSDLARDAHAGRLRIPLDELARAAIDPGLAAKPPWPDALAGLIRERLVTLRATVASNYGAPAPTDAASLRGLFVWARLAHRLASRVERALPMPVRAGRTDTLAESWHAWRAARSAGS